MNHSVKIIFGKEQVNKFYTNVPFTNEEINDFIKEYIFNSIEELNAFHYGMNEASGWLDFCEIHDQRINQTAELCFSINSYLGEKATLLYAGKTTNFIYKIENFNPSSEDIAEINEISTISKIKDRIEAISEKGGKLSYYNLEQDIFKNNLMLIDSQLPIILAEIIKIFFTSDLSTTADLTANLNTYNPLKYDTSFGHTFYDYKIKRFLTDVALGMESSKIWTGVYDATEGYLIVKENSDVLCYHRYNLNQFEDYASSLLMNSSDLRCNFINNRLFVQVKHPL